MAAKTITVTKIEGSSSIVTIHYTIGDQVGKAKAYKNEYQKPDAAFVVGKEYQVTFEKKGTETWIKKVKTGGFGGGRGSDPERIALDRERVAIEKAKQPMIIAEVILGQAVTASVAIAEQSKTELTTALIRTVALDLTSVLAEIGREVINRFPGGSLVGK